VEGESKVLERREKNKAERTEGGSRLAKTWKCLMLRESARKIRGGEEDVQGVLQKTTTQLQMRTRVTRKTVSCERYYFRQQKKCTTQKVVSR
jgi:hypothetical protein